MSGHDCPTPCPEPEEGTLPQSTIGFIRIRDVIVAICDCCGEEVPIANGMPDPDFFRQIEASR